MMRRSSSPRGIRCSARARCRSTFASASGSAIGPWSSPARTPAARRYRSRRSACWPSCTRPGLRVPAAEGARLPVFGRVMADIGDEQSIAQSLSTFSSHLRNVVRFVAAAGPGTLVLLDEIGAGTDPTEGSALAMAIVERLLAHGSDGRRHHPLRRAEGVRPGAPAGEQCIGRLRRGDAAAHLSAGDRAAGQVAGIRHRGAARPVGRRSWRMRDRGWGRST